MPGIPSFITFITQHNSKETKGGDKGKEEAQKETQGRDLRKRPKEETQGRDPRKRPKEEAQGRDTKKRSEKETEGRDQERDKKGQNICQNIQVNLF